MNKTTNPPPLGRHNQAGRYLHRCQQSIEVSGKDIILKENFKVNNFFT